VDRKNRGFGASGGGLRRKKMRRPPRIRVGKGRFPVINGHMVFPLWQVVGERLDAIRADGLFKTERVLALPQAALFRDDLEFAVEKFVKVKNQLSI